ncbi:hypothetical protein [Desulfitobacterium metallireducens]|uniref:Uncharacterized protein n=1 Tax=Desulfitobacterium metallireducens DSM 15288 TaxID=871968 RepID=W0EHD5_9FIRM|nr:hypothetical protein [Desulfitobacterium metallireducens]AHF08486.1 hypothetical protein DESME_04810 [Desulfitobacterium metallireducens DSM 15288]
MGFYSKSKSNSKGYYPHKNHGSDYYKESHKTGGILGKIFEVLGGSQRHSKSWSKDYKEHYPKSHNRKKSWS